MYIYLCLGSTQKLFGKPVHGMNVFGRELKNSHVENKTKRSKPFNVEVHFFGVEHFALRCEKGARGYVGLPLRTNETKTLLALTVIWASPRFGHPHS